MNSLIRKPDFFIVGAPKSGTTAMNTYLSEHPQVAMCSRKEVHYFAPDLYPHRNISESEYLGMFDIAPDTRRAGEASAWYLYWEPCAGRIKDFAPDADILVLLRNPVDMLYSLHGQWLFNGMEPRESFEEALSLDADREAGRVERRFVPTSYRAAAEYFDQVKRYLDVFGQDRVRIMLYEDFARDPGSEYRETCSFLDVDPSFTPDFRVVNSSKVVKSRALMRLLRRPPSGLRRVIPSSYREKVWRYLLRKNAPPARRPPVSPQVRADLAAHFAPELARLGELIGRDLSTWCTARDEGAGSLAKSG